MTSKSKARTKPKSSVTNDKSCISLPFLYPDILLSIFKWVMKDGNDFEILRNWRNVQLVCKHWSHIVKPLLSVSKQTAKKIFSRELAEKNEGNVCEILNCGLIDFNDFIQVPPGWFYSSWFNVGLYATKDKNCCLPISLCSTMGLLKPVTILYNQYQSMLSEGKAGSASERAVDLAFKRSIEFGHSEIFRFFISLNFSPDDYCLNTCISKHHTDITRFLLENCPDIRETLSQQHVRYAMKAPTSDEISLVLKYFPKNLTVTYEACLIDFATEESIEILLHSPRLFIPKNALLDSMKRSFWQYQLVIKYPRMHETSSSTDIIDVAIWRGIKYLKLTLKYYPKNTEYAFVKSVKENWLRQSLWLLKHYPEVSTAENNLAARLASQKGNFPLLNALLKISKSTTLITIDEQQIVNAAFNGDLTVVKSLITAKKDEIDNRLPFLAAIKRGSSKVLKFFLEDKNFDPNFDDGEAICLACSLGKSDIVNFLVKDKRIDVAVRDNYPLRIAASHGFASIVQTLLLFGEVDPFANSSEALESAKKLKNRRIIKMLESKTFTVQ